MDSFPRPSPSDRKPHGVRLWQLVVCLLLFVAALFLRAYAPVNADFLTGGSESLRTLAVRAGQAFARSDLIRAFSDSFLEARAAIAAGAGADPDAAPAVSPSSGAARHVPPVRTQEEPR